MACVSVRPIEPYTHFKVPHTHTCKLLIYFMIVLDFEVKLTQMASSDGEFYICIGIQNYTGITNNYQ